MRVWTYTVNSYYKTASYCLQEGRWDRFFIIWLITSICVSIPNIPIPFGNKIKIYDKYDKKYVTLNEYYGDIQVIFHVYICEKITRYCDYKIKETLISTDYENLKKERKHEAPELFDESIHDEFKD